MLNVKIMVPGKAESHVYTMNHTRSSSRKCTCAVVATSVADATARERRKKGASGAQQTGMFADIPKATNQVAPHGRHRGQVIPEKIKAPNN
jgi:hypothetical protein